MITSSCWWAKRRRRKFWQTRKICSTSFARIAILCARPRRQGPGRPLIDSDRQLSWLGHTRSRCPSWVTSCGQHDNEVSTGKLLRVNSKSHFLEHLARDTGGHTEVLQEPSRLGRDSR